jgi:hypothetical protein
MWGQPPRLSGPGKARRLILDSSSKSSRASLDRTAEGGCPHTRIGAAHVLSFPACDDVSVWLPTF